MIPAITTTELSKTFPNRKGTPVKALDGLSLEIHRGEVFGFLGPNGAGKSTTIKLLMGLIKPSLGSAQILGQDISSKDSRGSVGYLPENPSFYDFLTASEYLHFTGRLFGMRPQDITKQEEKILKRFNLHHARSRPLRSYSKGMLQRLGLAQTLVHNPDVFILDEPMSGLDPVGRALVKSLIQELKSQGKTIFFSSHIIADLEAVCDRVGIILHGRLKTIERIETITASGIVGYHLRYRRCGTDSQPEERTITKDQLNEVIAGLERQHMEILMIEPQRKKLEELFLEIVGSDEP